jgi:hypothetical protein
MITPTSPEPNEPTIQHGTKKMAHCHFCPEHVLTDKSLMEKFMLRKCEQKYVCKGHLHLVKANHLLKLVRPAQAAQAHLF